MCDRLQLFSLLRLQTHGLSSKTDHFRWIFALYSSEMSMFEKMKPNTVRAIHDGYCSTNYKSFILNIGTRSMGVRSVDLDKPKWTNHPPKVVMLENTVCFFDKHGAVLLPTSGVFLVIISSDHCFCMDRSITVVTRPARYFPSTFRAIFYRNLKKGSSNSETRQPEGPASQQGKTELQIRSLEDP